MDIPENCEKCIKNKSRRLCEKMKKERKKVQLKKEKNKGVCPKFIITATTVLIRDEVKHEI